MMNLQTILTGVLILFPHLLQISSGQNCQNALSDCCAKQAQCTDFYTASPVGQQNGQANCGALTPSPNSTNKAREQNCIQQTVKCCLYAVACTNYINVQLNGNNRAALIICLTAESYGVLTIEGGNLLLNTSAQNFPDTFVGQIDNIFSFEPF